MKYKNILLEILDDIINGYSLMCLYREFLCNTEERMYIFTYTM